MRGRRDGGGRDAVLPAGTSAVDFEVTVHDHARPLHAMNVNAAEHSAPAAAAPRSRVRAARSGPAAAALRARVQGLRADEQRMLALRVSARALLGSRALVWAAGSGTLATLGFGPLRKAFDPPAVTSGFGWLGDVLAGPAARWDAAWYLVIAEHGYRADLGRLTAPRAAFFPLYPLGIRAISWLGAPPVVAGVLLSLGALAVALYLIYRLSALELSRGVTLAGGWRAGEAARLAVLLTAFAPMAFFLSAVYSESLYLALSLAVFWASRHGRWALAGVLVALAGATRSDGIVLVVPALLLYLYGPREDRPPQGAAAGRLRPRYRPRRDVFWLALAPAGLAAFMCYLALSGGDALSPFGAQALWGRHFSGPFVGTWDGLKAAFEGARQLLSFQSRHVYYPAAGGSPSVAGAHNLLLAAFLLAALPAVVGVLRTLPFAYGAYTIVALAIPLSYPIAAQPLMSLPRFLLVLFPLTIWLANWLSSRPCARAAALVCSAASLAFFTAAFATWHWVA